MVIDASAAWQTRTALSAVPGTGQTGVWSFGNTVDTITMGSSRSGAGGPTPVTWTVNGQPSWAMTAVAVRPSATVAVDAGPVIDGPPPDAPPADAPFPPADGASPFDAAATRAEAATPDAASAASGAVAGPLRLRVGSACAVAGPRAGGGLLIVVATMAIACRRRARSGSAPRV
jgi:hypothetical protein